MKRFVKIQNFPFIPPGDYDGGPSCLAMVMHFYGKSLTLEEIGRHMFIHPEPGKSSSVLSLVMASQLLGFEAEMYEGDWKDLKVKIDAGFPLIAALHRDGDNQRKPQAFGNGDYMAVWGYDDRKEMLFVHAGTTPGRTIGYNDFKKQWSLTDNMMICIYPKESGIKNTDVPGMWRHNAFGRYRWEPESYE